MAPPKRFTKEHLKAVRIRNRQIRDEEGLRGVYNDTVRWWAHKHWNDNFQDAQRDPKLQKLWKQRNSSDKEERLEALAKLGILEQDEKGNWKYSNSFMTWLFT